MHYSSNCGCGCNYDCGCNTVPSTCCSTTNNITTTTTTFCIGENCDELYNCECVLYKGVDLTCYGIKNNTPLCDIIDLIISNIPDCINTDICFTVITDGIITKESCLVKLFGYWNNKPYYKIKNNNCTNLIGYVYWNSTDSQWEFSNKLGGGITIYSTLPVPSTLPISSTQWINPSPAIGILSSLSGFCAPTTTTSTTTTTTIPPTTTTTTIPCKCLSLYYDAGMSTLVSFFTYKTCDTNAIFTKSIAPNTTKNICTKQLINYDTNTVSVTDLGLCSSNCTSTTTTTRAPLPNPTTTSSTTSTTTTASPTTTSTTTTFTPICFTITDGGCVSGAGTGIIIISDYKDGGGNYQVTNTTYDNAISALNGTFIDNIYTNTYTSVPNGTRYVAVRDKNNPSNVTAKAIYINC